MNERIIFKNGDGKIFSCVLSGEADAKAQLEQVFDIRKGYGFSLDLYPDCIRIVDYFHGETRAEFQILSREQTAEPPDLHAREKNN